MKIGIDACCWANRRGYGRFTRELLPLTFALDSGNEYLLFADELAASRIEIRSPNVRTITVPTREAVTEAAGAQGNRSPGDLARMSRAVAREKLDWFFFPSVYSYFPILNRCRVAVTIHDTIAELYPSLIFPNRRARFFWNTKVWLAKRQADVIFTVSEFARDCLERVLKVSKDQCHVLLEAPSRDFLTGTPIDPTEMLIRLGLPVGTRYVVYLGGINPHKNLARLVRVFLAGCPMDSRLLLIGDYDKDSFHSGYAEVKAEADRRGGADRVIFTGFLPDAEAAALLRGSRGLVLPSLCEGFGLPAVEAMLIGTPVIATDQSALPELAPYGALFFSPTDEPRLAAHLNLLLENEAYGRELGARGREAVQRLDWAIAARTLVNVLNEVR